MDFECKVCGKKDIKSINFLGKKVCNKCLNKITNTDSNNKLYYEYYKSSIKEMWLDYITN